jgi:hypothetical protein
MTTRTLTITIEDTDIEQLVALLNSMAMDIEDDGNEGHPDAKLLDGVAKQIQDQK